MNCHGEGHVTASYQSHGNADFPTGVLAFLRASAYYRLFLGLRARTLELLDSWTPRFSTHPSAHWKISSTTAQGDSLHLLTNPCIHPSAKWCDSSLNFIRAAQSHYFHRTESYIPCLVSIPNSCFFSSNTATLGMRYICGYLL